MPSTADTHASPSVDPRRRRRRGRRAAVDPGLAEPIERAPRGRAHRLGRRAGLGGVERVGRLGERERPERLRGRDRPLRTVGQAAAQDGERSRPVLAGEPPERRLELAGGDRGQGGLHGLVGGLATHQGVERRGYHWVKSRSTGWRVGGESAGRK